MNIAAGQGLEAGAIAVVISNLWYNNEEPQFPKYGINNLPVGAGSNFNNWGHFSQVVWKGSRSVGCGTAACGPQTNIGSGQPSFYTVCMYSPPGITSHPDGA